MAVQYTTQEITPELFKVASKAVAGVSTLRPCSRAVALVLSTKRSKLSKAGAGGHKLVNDEVVDFLEEACDGKKHSLTSFCSLETVTDFKLNPQKGVRGQAALISLTGVIAADTDSAE